MRRASGSRVNAAGRLLQRLMGGDSATRSVNRIRPTATGTERRYCYTVRTGRCSLLRPVLQHFESCCQLSWRCIVTAHASSPLLYSPVESPTLTYKSNPPLKYKCKQQSKRRQGASVNSRRPPSATIFHRLLPNFDHAMLCPAPAVS